MSKNKGASPEDVRRIPVVIDPAESGRLNALQYKLQSERGRSVAIAQIVREALADFHKKHKIT